MLVSSSQSGGGIEMSVLPKVLIRALLWLCRQAVNEPDMLLCDWEVGPAAAAKLPSMSFEEEAVSRHEIIVVELEREYTALDCPERFALSRLVSGDSAGVFRARVATRLLPTKGHPTLELSLFLWTVVAFVWSLRCC